MFRFTIRDVLLVMVIVGLAVGWGIEHRAHVVASRARTELQWKLDEIAELVRDRGLQVETHESYTVLLGGDGETTVHVSK